MPRSFQQMAFMHKTYTILSPNPGNSISTLLDYVPLFYFTLQQPPSLFLSSKHMERVLTSPLTPIASYIPCLHLNAFSPSIPLASASSPSPAPSICYFFFLPIETNIKTDIMPLSSKAPHQHHPLLWRRVINWILQGYFLQTSSCLFLFPQVSEGKLRTKYNCRNSTDGIIFHYFKLQNTDLSKTLTLRVNYFKPIQVDLMEI